MSDYIDRQAVIDILAAMQGQCTTKAALIQNSKIWKQIKGLPSAQIEPLTDNEQRIFLAAMRREEKVCKQVDEEYGGHFGPYEDNLVRICHEITRKVKGALWTI